MLHGNTIGERVRNQRRDLGLSQTELANKAKISRTYLSLIERGEADNISFSILSQLALALGTSPSALTGEGGSEVVLSPSLRQFALEDGLDLEEVISLSGLALRGKEPQTAEDWRKLYLAIANALDSEG